jgi:hypothetical protein
VTRTTSPESLLPVGSRGVIFDIRARPRPQVTKIKRRNTSNHMKHKTSDKAPSVTLKDLKIKKDPKGGYKLTTLPSEIKIMPTVVAVDTSTLHYP